ncbi:MAG: GntR family transcriptional regulator [Clostridiales Family XIII bacterium]|nr:GntR family transcriptional regulator [Clostridiales Family XIII bacterium]
MEWEFTNDRPVYIQIIEELQFRMVTGFYTPGESFPPVRTLASEAQVNPNTMQRALAELESQGLLCTQRTNAKTLTEDREMLENLKKEMAKKRIRSFLGEMERLGFDRTNTIQLISQIKETIDKEVR